MEAVDRKRARPFLLDKPRIFEETQMARHAGLGHPQDGRQFGHVQRLEAQHANEPKPRLVAEEPQKRGRFNHIYKSTYIDVSDQARECGPYNGLVRTQPAASPVATLVLAHSAGAGQDHPWMTRVSSGLADRGITVCTFDFPYMEARRRTPDKGPVLEAAFVAAWTEVARLSAGPLFAGGKSMGGRIATQVAAQQALHPTPAGIVCFGYPLHPPGKPTNRRDRHLPQIPVPLLFLSGTRDPFGSPDELRALAAGLRNASLTLFVGGDHSIQGPKRKGAPDLLAQAIETAAEWMGPRGADRRAATG